MNEQRLCKRCNTSKPLTENYFHWEKGFHKICSVCLDKQRNNTKERNNERLEQKEQLRQRVKFFEECLKYYEAGDEQYRTDEVISFQGGQHKVNAELSIKYFQSQLKWMKEHLKTTENNVE